MPKKPRSSKPLPLTFEALKTFHEMVAEVKEDLKVTSASISDGQARKIAYRFEWAALYDTSYSTFMARLAHLNKAPLEQSLSEQDAALHLLKWARHSDEAIERALAKGNAKELAELAATIALIKNTEAMLLYGQSINALLDSGLKRNNEALFRAIRTDPSAVGTRKANQRIARAVLSGDSDFLEKLGNALKGKTGNARDYLSTARVVVIALHESGQLKKMKVKERADLLVGQLRLITDDPRKDTESNFNRFINRVLNGTFRQ